MPRVRAEWTPRRGLLLDRCVFLERPVCLGEGPRRQDIPASSTGADSRFRTHPTPIQAGPVKPGAGVW